MFINKIFICLKKEKYFSEYMTIDTTYYMDIYPCAKCFKYLTFQISIVLFVL